MRIKLNLDWLATVVILATLLPVIATADFLTSEPPFITLDPGVPRRFVGPGDNQ